VLGCGVLKLNQEFCLPPNFKCLNVESELHVSPFNFSESMIFCLYDTKL
jgi:hypothetical protein